MDIIIRNGIIVDGQLCPGNVVVIGGKIAFSGPQPLPTEIDGIALNTLPEIDCEGAYITPGFIDLHIHGANGFDTMDGASQALKGMAKYLAKQGTTGFLPTTVTAGLENLTDVAYLIKEYENQANSSEILGIHLEGPYINLEKKGAQYGDAIRKPSLAELKQLVDILHNKLRLITLAPEIPGNEQLIRFLVEQGITVSIGHSNATYDQVLAAFEMGISHVTHTFNGMRGLHHREPGVVGAALLSKGIFTELVADGVHVHPGVMRLLYEVKGKDSIVLVSDAVMASGLPDGQYNLGALPIWVTNGSARLADGTIAGSTLTLVGAVRNMVELVGVPLQEAVQMASLNPATSVKLENKGRIKPGYDGDLLILTSDLQLKKTIISGICVEEEA